MNANLPASLVTHFFFTHIIRNAYIINLHASVLGNRSEQNHFIILARYTRSGKRNLDFVFCTVRKKTRTDRNIHRYNYIYIYI